MMKRSAKRLSVIAFAITAFLCFTAFSFLTFGTGKSVSADSLSTVRLDMDGTEASLEAAGGVNNNVDNALGVGGLNWGIFPEATGATKMQFTAEQVAVGDGVTIRFGKSYKAADILFLKVRMATNGGSDAVTEAYSLTDTENKTSAGTLTSGSGVQNHDLYLEPSVLADEEGNIGGFYLKRVSGTDASYYYFDYVELRTNATGFDMDGVEASIEAEGGVTVRADNTFNKSGALDWGMFPEATGATKLSRTEGEIAVGGTVTVKLSFPVKAEEGKAIKVRMATETFACVLQGYALSDTSFERSAVVGQKTSDQGVSNFELVMYSEILADADGYVRGFVIKNTSGAEGRMDFDYVSVVDSATITKTVYDMDGIEATVTADGEVQTHADNTFNTTLPWGIFPEATGATKLMRTAGGIAEGASFKIILSTPIKEKAGKVLKVRLASEGVSGVTEGYALSDTEFVESAGKVASWNCIQNLNLYLDPAVLADVDGYIRGVTIRRTSGASVVYDIDYVEFTEIEELEVAEKPEEDVVLDLNGEDAWLEAGGEKLTKICPDNEIPVFSGATGNTMISFTEDIGNEEFFAIRFSKRYKAEYFDGVLVRFCAGNNFDIEGGANAVTTTAYSLSDTGFIRGAGIAVIKDIGNVERFMEADAALLADSDGYISGLILRKTETDTALTGQYFVDYVKLVLAGGDNPDPDKPDPDNPDPDNPDKPNPDDPKPYDPPIAEDPTENVVLDMNGVDAWLEVDGEKVTKIHPDNAIEGLFPDATGNTMISFTEDLGDGATVTVRFSKKYRAELLGKIRISLAIGNNFSMDGGANALTTTGYNVNDTEFLTPAGSVTVENIGNVNALLIMDASILADKDGYISGFVMKKTETDTSLAGQYFADEVILGIKDEKDPIADKTDENVVLDMNGSAAWLEVDGERVNKFTTDDFTEVAFGGDGDTKITWTEDLGDGATFVVRFAKRYKAEYFEKIKVRIAVGNWVQTGNIVTTRAYALNDADCTKSAGQIKTALGNVVKTLELDPAILADEEGYINGFIIKKTETDKNATGQYYFDYVELCLVGSEPPIIVTEDYTEKDVSEVMPIGAGKEFSLKTSGRGDKKTTIAASLKAIEFDKMNFKFTPTYNGSFSVYILIKAPDGKALYEDGGLFFWLTSESISIGAAADGLTNQEQVFVSDLAENPFASGKEVVISVAAIPYFVEGVQEGYYLALYLNGEENPIVSAYISNTVTTLGAYTNICVQDLGNDRSVRFAPATANYKTAEEIMGVTLATKSGKTEFTTARAALKLDYLEVEGTVLGEMIIDGDATFDKVTKFLTFGKQGDVKLKYTIRNAFGEFESNELTISYKNDKVQDGESGCGCSGAFESAAAISAVAILAAGIFIIIKKRKV